MYPKPRLQFVDAPFGCSPSQFHVTSFVLSQNCTRMSTFAFITLRIYIFSIITCYMIQRLQKLQILISKLIVKTNAMVNLNGQNTYDNVGCCTSEIQYPPAFHYTTFLHIQVQDYCTFFVLSAFHPHIFCYMCHMGPKHPIYRSLIKLCVHISNYC